MISRPKVTHYCLLVELGFEPGQYNPRACTPPYCSDHIRLLLENFCPCPTPQSLLTYNLLVQTGYKSHKARHGPSDFTDIACRDPAPLRSNRTADILRFLGLPIEYQVCGSLLEQPDGEELHNCQCGRPRVGTREIACVSPSLLCWAPHSLPLHLRNSAGTGEPSGDRRNQFLHGYDKPF